MKAIRAGSRARYRALRPAQMNPTRVFGHALKKLRARGATDDERTDLVRGMQAELLFSFCCPLDDPGDVETEVADLAWGLAQVDDGANVLGSIGGLHESVLEMDTTGERCVPVGGVAANQALNGFVSLDVAQHPAIISEYELSGLHHD